MTFFEKVGTAGALVIIAAFIALLIGWGMNIYALIMAAVDGTVTNWAMFILRILGVFVFPVGGVAGYF